MKEDQEKLFVSAWYSLVSFHVFKKCNHEI